MKDTYGREINYLRISVTDRCNLRCRYCMPEEGAYIKDHSDILSEDEIVNAANAAASLGIKKIRITGGEPLVKKNIVGICARIAKIPGIEDLCMTTNGMLLPKMAKSLVAAGVNRVNISLDTLKKEKAEYISRRNFPDDMLSGIKAALDAGFEKVKINCVLIGGFNDDEIEDIARLSIEYPVDVRFIELMPMYDSGDFSKEAFISNSYVLEKLKLKELQAAQQGEVSRNYYLENGQGKIGLISSVSDSFCKSCNRIRLTADGYVKPCLHSGEELYLKGLDEDGMKEVLKKAILQKPACHSELSYENRSSANRNMNKIGG